MSEYAKLKMSGLPKGRRPLPAEEKERRNVINQKKQEARRRAGIVLQHKYADEFALLCDAEFNALLSQ
jgi:hypothetical protein